MHDTELTMTEALHDPMIRLLLRADRISLGAFARLMENAARTKDLPHRRERTLTPVLSQQ